MQETIQFLYFFRGEDVVFEVVKRGGTDKWLCRATEGSFAGEELLFAWETIQYCQQRLKLRNRGPVQMQV